MNIQKIINCYDSHTHFWATGQVAEGLKLQHLTSAADVLNLSLQPSHQRQNWIVGFGWNHLNWPGQALPNKAVLDKIYQHQPVFFSRVDGHASWLNSKALAELKDRGYDFSIDPAGGRIERDASGEPTGVLFDQAHIQALLMLPDFSTDLHRHFFSVSQNIFNRAGFTHVRDLSMNPFFWNLLREMEDQNKLTVCLDSFVTAENLSHLEEVLKDVKRMQVDSSKQLRVHGVKIFIDGSLGSKSAYLSQNYLGTEQHGVLIWPYEDIKTVIEAAWRAGQQVAIHTIGDQASAMAVKAAREIAAQGVLGRLHLEHVQVLSHETLQMMKPLHVTCHMQPCHWLSDSPWLRSVLPEPLVKNLFQWELLRKNKVPFYLGSDSPIEKPSLFDNRKALIESAKWGVPELQGNWISYHQHPDRSWCPSFTEIDDESVKQVYFNGEPLLS
jgi:predicted amidohydrolase YtcJ